MTMSSSGPEREDHLAFDTRLNASAAHLANEHPKTVPSPRRLALQQLLMQQAQPYVFFLYMLK